MKRWIGVLAFSVLLISATQASAAEADTFAPHDSWYVLKLGGQRAGYMHSTLQKEGNQLVSNSVMKIAIKRGEAEVTINQSTRFVETLDHKPVSAQTSMKFALMATQQELAFGDKQWTLTTTTAGQANTTKIDPPDTEWLTPGAMASQMGAAIARGDKKITTTTLDLSMGVKPVTATMTRGKSEDIEVFGKVVPATKWALTMDAAPGMTFEQWSDEAGQPVRQVVALMPGMEMEMLLADKALATAEFDAPEMLASSLITPDKPIRNPRKLHRAVYEIKAKDLKQRITDTVPNTSVQTADWVDGDTLRITITLDGQPRIIAEAPGESYLAATSMLNHEDEKIRELIKQASPKDPAAGGKAIPAKKHAMVLTTFVRDHIDAKDLSVGFASASEVARTQQGDCTEHGCLLAAMLRGAGIPSRTVTGLVYADQFAGHEGVFGFHMWAQAWIQTDEDKGYWVDVDAAMPGQIQGFDATHIALTTSAMAEGETFNDMVKMLPLLQGMEIKAVKLEWAK